VVDDERQIRRALAKALTDEGYLPLLAESGEEALRVARKTPPDMVVLDLALPSLSGLEVCRALRERSQMPILVLSARTREPEKVAALDLGADDYVTKPFGMDELLARVRALLRRSKRALEPQQPIRAGDLVIDLNTRTVTARGAPVDLTRMEFEILRLLACNSGRVLTHGMILQQVWGPEYEYDVQTLRVHVANLRKKIEPDPARPRYVVTEMGVGYRFLLPEGNDPNDEV
jgi:two-component system KDP operon response regulator KdpE